MKNTPFDIIVNYLSKFQGKSIDNEKIKDKLQNILDKEYTESKMYKMIYYLKIRGHLVKPQEKIFFSLKIQQMSQTKKPSCKQTLLDNSE